MGEDPRAEALYAAERRAAASVPLRRFRRFADIEAYVEQVVLSSWWSDAFPSAPLEVEVLRRSRSATFSAAATTGDEVGLVALVDGHGWGLETVLHELAHLAAGGHAGHGPRFAGALEQLWRHEAGVEAWAALRAALGPAPAAGPRGGPGAEGVRRPGDRRGGAPPDGCPRRRPPP